MSIEPIAFSIQRAMIAAGYEHAAAHFPGRWSDYNPWQKIAISRAWIGG